MSERKIVGTAIVAVTLEVPTGSWGAGCTLEQVMKQASEEAVGLVTKLINAQVVDGIKQYNRNCRVVDAKVKAIIQAEEAQP